jgi:asparagine synthase (glutamine-hydrolysing)
MCGINGIIYSDKSGREVEVRRLTQMRDILHHRGPDETGIFIENNVGLGHRRLSIVDLKSGQQPMFNDDMSCVIVYNGEIYNHNDYRRKLIEKATNTNALRHGNDSPPLRRIRRAGALNICAECSHSPFGDKRKKELLIARTDSALNRFITFMTRTEIYFSDQKSKTLLGGSGS